MREVYEEAGVRVEGIAHLAYCSQIDHPQRAAQTTAFVFEIGAWSSTLGSRDPDGEILQVEFAPLADALVRSSAMKTRVQKWGHSLAVRIPKSFAIEAGLDQDAVVDIALVDGTLVVTPLAPAALDLEHLLAAVTTENLHHEYDMGSAVGSEVW